MGTEVLRPHDCLTRPIPSFRKPNPNPRPKRRPKPQQPVMGHVTILKRGESLDSTKKKKNNKEEMKEAPLVPDPPVLGPDPLGPDPLLVPRRIRLVSGRVGEVYAGSAFAMSPSPRKVPMPSFSRRKEAPGCSATEDLRRMLRLD